MYQIKARQQRLLRYKPKGGMQPSASKIHVCASLLDFCFRLISVGVTALRMGEAD